MKIAPLMSNDLRLFSDLISLGGRVRSALTRGSSIQCVDRPSRSFGLAKVALVPFDNLHAWMTKTEETGI